MADLKNPKTGGEVLLEKHGANYFRKLAKKGWETRRKQKELWKKAQKTNK